MAGFARWLAERGADVEVLAADPRRPIFYRGGAPAALKGRGWLEAARFTAALTRAAAGRVRGWDAIVSHWLVPGGAVGALVAGARPHLAIAHGSDVRLLTRLPGGRALARTLSRRADLVYVAEALALGGAPGRVVPMPIAVEEVAGGDRNRGRARYGLDGLVVLYLGRLVGEKGPDLAIDALPPSEDLTLVVAGDGPARAALEGRAGPRVRFVGEVRGQAKRDLLAACDVLVIPSRQDGAPQVALEGLAAGRAIVATRAGGLPELLRGGETALLCAPEAAAIRAALERLRDPSLRLRLSTAARAAARAHDWSTVGPRLAGALADKLSGSRNGSIAVTRV